MGITIGKIVATNIGGHVVHLQGDVQLNVGSIDAETIAGSVLHIETDKEQQVLALGLPREVDARALAELLQALAKVEPDARIEHAQKSALITSLGKFALNLTTVASNLATVAASTQLHQIIKNLTT